MDDAYLFDMSAYPSTHPESERGHSMNCDAGQLAELRFFAEASAHGMMVYAPLGHSTDADCIVWRGSGFPPVTVQIKKGVSTAWGAWKITVGAGRPSRLHLPDSGEKRYRRYLSGDFDVLVMRVKERDSFVMWKLDDLEEKTITWRPDNGRGRENNWDIFERFTQ